jgi:hypothetical protein
MQKTRNCTDVRGIQGAPVSLPGVVNQAVDKPTLKVRHSSQG